MHMNIQTLLRSILHIYEAKLKLLLPFVSSFLSKLSLIWPLHENRSLGKQGSRFQFESLVLLVSSFSLSKSIDKPTVDSLNLRCSNYASKFEIIHVCM